MYSERRLATSISSSTSTNLSFRRFRKILPERWTLLSETRQVASNWFVIFRCYYICYCRCYCFFLLFHCCYICYSQCYCFVFFFALLLYLLLSMLLFCLILTFSLLIYLLFSMLLIGILLFVFIIIVVVNVTDLFS